MLVWKHARKRSWMWEFFLHSRKRSWTCELFLHSRKRSWTCELFLRSRKRSWTCEFFFFFFLWFSSNLNFHGSSTIPNHNSPKLLLLLLFPRPHLPVKANNRNIEVNNKNDIALVSWTYFTPCSSVSIAIYKHVIAGWVNTNFNVGTDVTSDQDARVIEISLDNRNSELPNVYFRGMSRELQLKLQAQLELRSLDLSWMFSFCNQKIKIAKLKDALETFTILISCLSGISSNASELRFLYDFNKCHSLCL